MWSRRSRQSRRSRSLSPSFREVVQVSAHGVLHQIHAKGDSKGQGKGKHKGKADPYKDVQWAMEVVNYLFTRNITQLQCDLAFANARIQVQADLHESRDLEIKNLEEQNNLLSSRVAARNIRIIELEETNALLSNRVEELELRWQLWKEAHGVENNSGAGFAWSTEEIGTVVSYLSEP